MSTPKRIPWTLVLFLIAALIPVLGSRYYTFLATDIIIFAMFATSLNDMAQRNSRASVERDENVLCFRPPSAPNAGATALDLVYQAADVFRSMEEHA